EARLRRAGSAELVSDAVLRRRVGDRGPQRGREGEGLGGVVLPRPRPVSVDVVDLRGLEPRQAQRGFQGEAGTEPLLVRGGGVEGVVALASGQEAEGDPRARSSRSRALPSTKLITFRMTSKGLKRSSERIPRPENPRRVI